MANSNGDRFNHHTPMPQLYCNNCQDTTSHQVSHRSNGQEQHKGVQCESCHTFTVKESTPVVQACAVHGYYNPEYDNKSNKSAK